MRTPFADVLLRCLQRLPDAEESGRRAGKARHAIGHGDPLESAECTDLVTDGHENLNAVSSLASLQRVPSLLCV